MPTLAPPGCISRAFEHIRALSETVGGRGSGAVGERWAAEYALQQMQALGLRDARLEPFQGAPSTYRPYALAFAAAIGGTLLAWIVSARWALALGALLSALGAWGMAAEADLAFSWPRLLLPRAASQNAVAIIPPMGEVRREAILCAHLDTHRTPIFYSTRAWLRLFSFLVGGALLSMVVVLFSYGLGALLGWQGARWVGLVMMVVQSVALGLCLHADFTPFSPGANDDASGVALVLVLAERLRTEPLAHTKVWVALTGCEETGAHGMSAFLREHGAELGPDAVYVILDQVGIGQLTYLTADGLIRKHRTHPLALDLARQASAALPGLALREQVGLAYTDALVATKQGNVALTLNTLPSPGAAEVTHWHQMTDTAEHIDPNSLADSLVFTKELLQQIDRLQEEVS